MPNLVVGDNGSNNSLQGTAGPDYIYGYNPAVAQTQADLIIATRVATGLAQPLFVGSPSGDPARLFIVEQTGRIEILDLITGQVLANPFLNLAGQINASGESGLLGLAFDPNFGTNGFFYVSLVNLNGDSEIRRYHVSANPNIADAASALSIITIPQPDFTNHKAGWIGFGPGGDLYAALGDGGGGGDPLGSGQDINSLLGKILRLDVQTDGFPGDATRNYAVPADNPFVGKDGADEIFAYGLRNPWRPSFDSVLGTFYIADVGQGQWEEVNIGQKGANYGWNVYEGPAVYAGGTPTGGSAVPPFISTVTTWGNRSRGATSIGATAKLCKASISLPTSCREKSSACASMAARGPQLSEPRRSRPPLARSTIHLPSGKMRAAISIWLTTTATSSS